jgi:hypothetical protein
MSTIYAYDNSNFEEIVLYKNAQGVAMNLTGHTSIIKVTKYYGSSVVVTINGTIQAPSTNGIFKYNATAIQIAALDYGTNVYTRYLYDSLGNTVSVVNGSFVLIPTV